MLLKEYVVGLQFLTIYDIYYTYNPNTNRYYLKMIKRINLKIWIMVPPLCNKKYFLKNRFSKMNPYKNLFSNKY